MREGERLRGERGEGEREGGREGEGEGGREGGREGRRERGRDYYLYTLSFNRDFLKGVEVKQSSEWPLSRWSNMSLT